MYPVSQKYIINDMVAAIAMSSSTAMIGDAAFRLNAITTSDYIIIVFNIFSH